MAISAVHYHLLKEHAHLLKRGGSLLEIGEANWYGDMDPMEILKEAPLPGYPPETYQGMRDACENGDLFRIAKFCYFHLFLPSVIDSVDMNGTPTAFRQDLNGPLNLPRQYDTIINHGTAEHVFNIAMVFKSMHDACVTDGIMIHESPFTGWVDHGFYCLQPTLFYDLAAANEYELISLSIAEITKREIVRIESREHMHNIAGHVPKNALLFVVMRKTVDVPFRIPMQGIYDGRLSEKGKENWHALR